MADVASGVANGALTGASTLNPWAMLGGAAIGGLGAYFGADAQKQMSDEQIRLQQAKDAEDTRRWNLQNNQMLASKTGAQNVLGGYDTSGYSGTLNYQDPYAGSMLATIQKLMAGGLTDSEKAQQLADISKGSEMINSNASSSGMPAGARLGLQGQNVQQISRDYANMGSGRVAQGVSLGNTAAGTGANIASMNYQAGLNNFLNTQKQKNDKLGLLAQYQ